MCCLHGFHCGHSQNYCCPKGIIWDGPAIIDPPLHCHHCLHIHNCHDYCPERVHFISVLCMPPPCLPPSPAFLLFQVDYCNSPLESFILCTFLFIFMTFIMKLDKIPSIFPFLLTSLMFYFKDGHSFLSKCTDCDIIFSLFTCKYISLTLSYVMTHSITWGECKGWTWLDCVNPHICI